MTTGRSGSATKSRGIESTRTSSPEDAVRQDLAHLVEDVRAALDELAVRADLATMDGRDLLRAQVAEVEDRLWKVKQELGLAKSETDATVDTLRAGLAKAEQAVRHVVEAVVVGVRKS